MKQAVKISTIELITHDVLRIITEKPEDLTYKPGQVVDISINKDGWKDQRRSFTFTSLPQDNHIEFTIKTYPKHKGVTNQLRSLRKGDELLLHDVYGDIVYKGDGIFIAGGAGVTPFIAIFKHLAKENKVAGSKLIFANKTKSDIIFEDKLTQLLGHNLVNILSQERCAGYDHGYVSPELIKKHTSGSSQYFYLCGPHPMMYAVEKQLSSLGIADNYIVKESL